jgi:hypothetical protein
MDGEVRPERIAGVIDELSPDVVALQEVDAGIPRTHHQDQAKIIAKILGMDYRFFPVVKNGDQNSFESVQARASQTIEGFIGERLAHGGTSGGTTRILWRSERRSAVADLPPIVPPFDKCSKTPNPVRALKTNVSFPPPPFSHRSYVYLQISQNDEYRCSDQ